MRFVMLVCIKVHIQLWLILHVNDGVDSGTAVQQSRINSKWATTGDVLLPHLPQYANGEAY